MEEKPTFEISDKFVSITGSHTWKIPEFPVWIKSQPNGEPCLGPQFQIKSCLPLPIKKFRLIIFRLSELDVRLFLKNCSDGDIIIDTTVKLSYNELGYNKLPLIANKFQSLVGFQYSVHPFSRL
jgi:hypothetical protein